MKTVSKGQKRAVYLGRFRLFGTYSQGAFLSSSKEQLLAKETESSYRENSSLIACQFNSGSYIWVSKGRGSQSGQRRRKWTRLDCSCRFCHAVLQVLSLRVECRLTLEDSAIVTLDHFPSTSFAGTLDPTQTRRRGRIHSSTAPAQLRKSSAERAR